MDSQTASATVSSIFIYPIKSCRGMSVPSATISSTGFRWDRQWVVVNSKGRAYTQRVEPKLALVEVELPTEAFNEAWEPSCGSYLVVRAAGTDMLKVSLSRRSNIINDVSVWEWSGSAYDEGDEAAKWFSDYLGKPSRLVRFNTAAETRPVDSNYASGYKTMFSDGYPFLVISQDSLDALNKLLKEPVPINRFSILVEGCGPFAEDLWADVKINEAKFHGVKLCSRCKVPTINQENAIAGDEPMKTLQAFRSDRVLRPTKKSQNMVYFGHNLVCEESCRSRIGASIQVGDHVYVTRKFASHVDAAA